MKHRGLFSRRLLFTVGKGGVGRTTITLALALAAARQGKRVLLVELEGSRSLERGLGELRASGDAPAELRRIESIVVDGRRALEEYLAIVVPVRRLLETIFRSTVYQYFVAVAPGLKELMAIGKIWFEADRLEREGEGPDLVLVDAPATGHGLQYLRMPQAAVDAFPIGLVQREAERVSGLLRDHERAGAVLVALPEETPTNEAIEMSNALEEIGLCRSLLVVNAYHESRLSWEELESLEAAFARQPELSDGLRSEVAGALASMRSESEWAAINEQNVERLEKAIDENPVVLPYVFCEEFSTEEILHLSRSLENELETSPPQTPEPR